MRILVVSNIFPYPPDRGITKRIYHITMWLAARHDVTLVSLATPEDDIAAPPLREACERVITVEESFRGCALGELWDPALRQIRTLLSSPYPQLICHCRLPRLCRELQDLRQGPPFDVVWVQRASVAEHVSRLGFAPIVVDMADIESEVLGRNLDNRGWYWRKPLHYAELVKLKRYERTIGQRFGVTACKESDRERLRGDASRTFVVPNGFDTCDPVRPGLETAAEMLFVGAFTWGPNVDACRHFVSTVFPAIRQRVPSARFVIVGRSAKVVADLVRGRDGCVVVDSPEDLTPYYESASIVVVPIRLGSGTRLKVLEALARGKAVVSTTMGAEGLGVESGKHLVLADTPDRFAAECVRLLQDADARRALASTGSQFIRSRYTWEAIGAQAGHALQQIATLPTPHTAPRHAA